VVRLYIGEVPGSILYTETGYRDWGFSWLYSVLPGKFRGSTKKLGQDLFIAHPLQFIILLSLFHLTLYNRDLLRKRRELKYK
jgi:hypothetical protein